MKSARQFHCMNIVFLIVIGNCLAFQRAGATTLCTDLPPSILQVFDLKAPAVKELSVPAQELGPRGQTADLASRHTMMLTVSNIVTWFDITHRIVPREDGLVCDAPSLVRMGFGSSRRFAFLAHAAAEDACVRQQMLDHEAAHTSAFEKVVDQFIDRQESSFQRGVTALKQTPAPDAKTAKTRWETGLRAMVIEAREQLFAEL
jgi:hypothetical protein